MHGTKSAILLLVVLGGLGGYIYFVDSKRDPAAATANAKAFTDLVADNIEEIEIRNADGVTSHVQRVGTDWQLVAPDKADADDGVVGTVTSNLSTLEVQRVVDENPTDLAQYGLNPPRIDVSFRLKDQKDFQRLLVGEKTPTGGDFFAKRPNENRVFLISSFLDSIFNKTTFDLRDKAVLKFDRNQAQAIEIVSGASTTQFTGSGSEWRIAKPMSARADYAAVEGLMTRLSSTFMQKIVERETTDLRAVRARPAGAFGHRHGRKLEGHIDHRTRGRRRPFRQGRVAIGDLHRGRNAIHGAQQGSQRVPSQRSLRWPVIHGESDRGHAGRGQDRPRQDDG